MASSVTHKAGDSQEGLCFNSRDCAEAKATQPQQKHHNMQLLSWPAQPSPTQHRKPDGPLANRWQRKGVVWRPASHS